MAAFPLLWSDTSTWYGSGANYYTAPNYLREVGRPLVTARAWARICLAALRAPTPRVWRPLEFAWSSPPAAPRRAVVARGHVSWIRAGTRRPL